MLKAACLYLPLKKNLKILVTPGGIIIMAENI